MNFNVETLVDHLFRRQSAQIVSALTRALGGRHLDLAEEAVQDALVTALQQWPYRRVPDDPVAWLFRVARNRVLIACGTRRWRATKRSWSSNDSGRTNRAIPRKRC